MQYTELGNTGLRVSRLGFGAMRLPQKDGGVDFDLSVRLMRHAFDLGVNCVDSQFHYCGDLSEDAVGRAIAGRRDRIIVQTKATYYDKPEYAAGENHRTRLELTLKKLGTDYLDIYFMHSLSLERWEEFGEEWMEMALRAREEGLIRHIGFSSHDSPDHVIQFLEAGHFEVVLMQYNLLDQRYEPAFARAAELGVGAAVMGPVGGGRLAGLSPELTRAGATTYSTNAELALRFALSNPHVNVALSGMRSIEEIEENCATASREEPLSPEERADVERVIAEKHNLAELYCSGCGYCMPCPNNVGISVVFEAMALQRIWGLPAAAGRKYRALMEEQSAQAPASACVECGRCVPKCPQNINIPERLKEAVEMFERESAE